MTTDKSQKCALRLPESFEIQLQNFSKNPEPAGEQNQPTPPISTFQNDPQKTGAKPRRPNFGPLLSPEAVFRAIFGLPEPFSVPHRKFLQNSQKGQLYSRERVRTASDIRKRFGANLDGGLVNQTFFTATPPCE